MNVGVSEATVRLVKDEARRGCFLCRRILEAIGPDRTLADWPPGSRGSEAEFPVSGQRDHILLLTGRTPE